MNPIICFTDGACPKNGKAGITGGIGIYFPNENIKVSEPVPNATNNKSELSAILRALQIVLQIDPGHGRSVTIYTDSQLAINTFTKWVKGWKRANWKKRDGEKPKNLDIIIAVDAILQYRKVAFKYVPAHTGRQDFESLGNDMADKLATSASASSASASASTKNSASFQNPIKKHTLQLASSEDNLDRLFDVKERFKLEQTENASEGNVRERFNTVNAAKTQPADQTEIKIPLQIASEDRYKKNTLQTFRKTQQSLNKWLK